MKATAGINHDTGGARAARVGVESLGRGRGGVLQVREWAEDISAFRNG